MMDIKGPPKRTVQVTIIVIPSWSSPGGSTFNVASSTTSKNNQVCKTFQAQNDTAMQTVTKTAVTGSMNAVIPREWQKTAGIPYVSYNTSPCSLLSNTTRKDY